MSYEIITKVEFNELAKSVTANTKIEIREITDEVDNLKEKVINRSDFLLEENKRLFNNAMIFSNILSEEKSKK